MIAITPSFLLHRPVLFVVDPSLGIERHPFVDVGKVEFVDEAGRQVTVSFMYHGYKTTVEWVPFSHILAVFEPKDGKMVEMYRFSGYGYDLRGVEPFGSHELAKR